MNGLRETCHCGHDKSSHYRDAGDGKLYSCLCRGCECRAYANEFEQKPVPPDPITLTDFEDFDP